MNYNIFLFTLSTLFIIFAIFNYNPFYSLMFSIVLVVSLGVLLTHQNLKFISLMLSLIYLGALLILIFFLLLLLNLQTVIRDSLHTKKVPLVIVPLIFI